MIRSYKDLKVYNKSYEMCIKVYKYAMSLPKEESYCLSSQMKRASMSIPLNIAEGYAKRESTAEFKRFLFMSLGSSSEMQVLLDMCKDLNFIEEKEYEFYKGEYDEISKMLRGLINKWSKWD